MIMSNSLSINALQRHLVGCVLYTTQLHVHGVTRPTGQSNLIGTCIQNPTQWTVDRTEQGTGVLVTFRL